MMLHLANLTLRLYKDELGLASDNVSPLRFWMRSLPGAGWMVTIAASRAWGSTLRWRSWISHLLTVDAHLGVAARLRYLDKGAELLPPSRSSSRPGCRQARSTSGGNMAGLRIIVVANPQGTIAPLALRNQLSCQWNVLGPLKGAYQQYPWHSSRRPDVDRCIGGWAGASGEEDSAALPLRINAWVGSGSDGYAFPGHRKGRAWVEKATVSRTLEVGRLVSWGSLCWFSAPCPGCLSPGRAWGAYRSWTTPFTSRNWPANSSLTTLSGAARGYGGPPGGAVSCDASVSLYCLHPAGQTVPPLPGL